MNKCLSCGNENPDNSVTCTACGQDLSVKNQQPDSNAQQNNRVNVNFSSNGFVSGDEYVVATLSNGVTDNILSGEGFKTEDAILTNKRLYYKHRTGVINVRSQVETINVKDITGSKILNHNPLGALIIAILIVVVGIAAASFVSSPIIIASAFSSALFFFVVYIIARKAHLRIEYAGGAIHFSVKRYRKANILSFQKSIYAVKDHIEKNGQ